LKTVIYKFNNYTSSLNTAISDIVMRSPSDYVEKLLSMKPNIYIGGKRVGRDFKAFQPGIKTISMTYQLAGSSGFKDLITAESHLTGERINRFTHICQNPDDLLKKQEMIRRTCQIVGRCIQRCMGCDAINALSVVTREVDDKYGTDYYKRFLKYLYVFQKEDLTAACAQTDVKGDRSLRPFQQHDPDLYLRVVKRMEDGVIVRGAKTHITIAPYADEIIALPTRAMTERDVEYAVAFAIPADWDGVKLITVSHNHRERKELKAPITEYSASHSMVVFDDVFVPWDRVFMCGEWEFAGRLAMLFATYHRHSYTGCKPAMTDILMGAAALAAEYNGIEGAHHVRDKLADMVATAELVYAAGIASAVKGVKASSGTFIPNIVYANVGRYHAGVKIYSEFEVVADIAGGIAATVPYEEDYLNPEVRKYIEKYIARKKNIPSEHIYRCFKFIQDLICSAPAAASQISGVHGGGSPIMERITIMANYDIESKKKIAKYLAGIEEEF
jgi:4-hydroxyphenylacetate 3-monooxygenase/4-hydroxybutyryl-CoA dehydratase/vinylacetyl-CoA-Delta-isomerase